MVPVGAALRVPSSHASYARRSGDERHQRNHLCLGQSKFGEPFDGRSGSQLFCSRRGRCCHARGFKSGWNPAERKPAR